jgi:TDG/mug DNA glycosylase family protein
MEAREYYAHKGNAFWRIMGDLFGAGLDKPYSERVLVLNDKGIAVWDVIKSCVRPGSGDLDIRDEEPNDFNLFFKFHPRIETIGLNGQKAADCFKKMKIQTLSCVTHVTLPSTSPANARSNFEEKRDAWRALILS